MKNALIVLVALVGIFFLGRWTKRCTPVTFVRADTVVRVNTIRDTVLVPKRVYISRVDTCLLSVPGDTVKVPVIVPIERKDYQTEDYRATIEGFRPNLVSMEVYPKTTTITKTQTQTITKKTRWGIGPQIGYGFNGKEWKPYIGIGIQYNLFTF